MTWTIAWGVAVNGTDLTAAWDRHLISISVTDKAGTASDSCNLEVDDTGGQIRLPKGGEGVAVTMAGALVFAGVINSVTSKGGRSGGRTLSVAAKGFDTAGGAKHVQAFHMDDATLGDFLGHAADNAGFTLTIDPQLAAIAQDYWSAEHESFLALGDRLARRFGGTFKLRGTQAVLARRGDGISATGQPLPTVNAIYGQNLLDWSISPRDPRRIYASGQARYFDRESADYNSQQTQFEGTEGVGENVLRLVEADASSADAALEARGRESERESGGGTITLNLTPTARAECTVFVAGARPGIDGRYRAESVTHRADRSGGATTSLSLKQPGEGAGTDDRAAS